MGKSSQSSSITGKPSQFEDLKAKMDASANIDNESHRHKLYLPGGTGVGAPIYLQNLQAAKFQLQQLGANAVYVPESNSLFLLQ